MPAIIRTMDHDFNEFKWPCMHEPLNWLCNACTWASGLRSLSLNSLICSAAPTGYSSSMSISDNSVSNLCSVPAFYQLCCATLICYMWCLEKGHVFFCKLCCHSVVLISESGEQTFEQHMENLSTFAVQWRYTRRTMSLLPSTPRAAI